MGKTPEKASGSMGSGVVMRYRRKVPATPSPLPTAADEPVSVDAKQQQEDNQMEHDAAPTVNEACNDKSEALRLAPKQKTLNPGGPARKKKPKAQASVQETPEKADDAARIVDGSVGTTATPVVAALPKKKLKKRQLPNNNASDEPEPVESQPQDESVAPQHAEPVKAKPTKQIANRKHKNDVNNGKHKGPSLLKQLLWKAKPVPPPVQTDSSSLPSESAPQNAESLPPVAVTAQQKHKQSKLKRSPRPSVEDQDEQEEMAYTVSERQSRKLLASKNSIPSPADTSDSCGADATAVVGGELSSQDTQFGSDEEEATASFLTAYENLVPSAAIEPKELSTAVYLNVFYPAPFPLALATDVELLTQHGITVHKVLLEDFAFQPQQLRVQPGDVVVWNVSVQTLGMVEHALEASLMVRDFKQKKTTFIKATTPPLGSGSAFAWRFKKPARVHIECSVYKTKGVVVVAKNHKAKKDKRLVAAENTEPTIAAEVPIASSLAPQPSSKALKQKEKFAKRKRAAAEARAAATVAAAERAEVDTERGRDSLDADAVFHPPQDLTRSAEMDAGVCRAVLTQLEEVAAAVNAASSVIVIGDVECPVLPEYAPEDPVDHASSHVHPDAKPSALADEWSGTEEDDDEEEDARSVSSNTEENEIEDFQQRIIGMLKRSEETRAQHRRSFQQDHSGFDAGAAYDFFKQRFMQVQEERRIVYAVCPEQQSGSGVDVTEVVSLLSGPSA